MLTFNQLVALLAGQPAALWADWCSAILANQTPGTEAKVSPAKQRSVAGKAGNIAVIPVQGVITGRRSFWEEIGLVTSMETLLAATTAAVRDPDVKAIVWDMNTPGGSTNGLAEAHAALMELRGQKPVIAQVNQLSASAGYWLASAADEIAASPSSLTGSIGVYMMHTDISDMAAQAGISVEFIHAGEHKVEGNQFEPLSEDARAHFQSLVDYAYAQFTGDVARGRGIDIATVQGDKFGGGRVLTADKAKAAGMVDVIRTMGQTLEAYGGGAPTGGTLSQGGTRRRARALTLRELDK